MTTPTIEAIEEEFDREFTVEKIGSTGWVSRKMADEKYANPRTLKALIRKAFLAGRQSMADEIEGEMPEEKDPNGNDYSYKSRDWNACRAQVLEIIAKLKANPTYHEPQPDK